VAPRRLAAVVRRGVLEEAGVGDGGRARGAALEEIVAEDRGVVEPPVGGGGKGADVVEPLAEVGRLAESILVQVVPLVGRGGRAEVGGSPALVASSGLAAMRGWSTP